MENLSPQIIRQVIKEMHEIYTNSPEGIKVQINEADVTDIQAVLEGPGNDPNPNHFAFSLYYYFSILIEYFLFSWDALCWWFLSC